MKENCKNCYFGTETNKDIYCSKVTGSGYCTPQKPISKIPRCDHYVQQIGGHRPQKTGYSKV